MGARNRKKRDSGERWGERERQPERQTEREKERQRERKREEGGGTIRRSVKENERRVGDTK